MIRTLTKLGAFLLVSFYALPAYAQYDPFTIVPDACRSCPAAWLCVISIANNLVTFAITIAVFIVIVVIAWAGILLIFTPTNPENKSQAKKMLINAVIGLVIALSAWLVVDKILEVLGAEGINKTTQVLGGGNGPCIIGRDLASNPIPDGGITATPGDPGYVCTNPEDCPAGASGMNISEATKHLLAAARAGPTAKCWQYVRRAMCAGGMARFCTGGMGNAADVGPYLDRAGLSVVYSGSYSRGSDSAFQYKAGDIVIFQPVPGHKYGHAAMYTGSKWVSDYVQGSMSSNPTNYQGGSFKVYRP